jgi:hypothetical protein
LINYGASYGDTRKLRGAYTANLGFTFNWYSYSGVSSTSIRSNGCLYFSRNSGCYLCPYQSSSYTGGVIFFRSTTSASDLAAVNSVIRQTYFFTSSRFAATNAFLVTFSSFVNSNGQLNTFQAVLATNGSYDFVIYSFGNCGTRNGRTFVQTSFGQYIMWDNFASYSSIADYSNTDSSLISQPTNACNKDQFVYSYPVQTVECSATKTTSKTIFTVVFLSLLSIFT